MQPQTGIFTISLDFELYWGIFEKTRLEDCRSRLDSTRRTIPAMLQLFQQYGVHVTWAVVGMLLAKDWEEWESWKPEKLPDYDRPTVNAYQLRERYAQDKTLNNCFFAPDLVETITRFEHQELATHTYSHYFCQESGQDVQAFEADLKTAVYIGKTKKIDLTSLVFPRNQIREDYLSCCAKQGIKAVRGNPDSWYWQDTGTETFAKKIFRTGDALLPIGKANVYDWSAIRTFDDQLKIVPASRLFRPHGPTQLLNKLRLKRILDELSAAAKQHQVYHLWWHPHNFGAYPQESLQDLKVILKQYQSLKSRYGMKSLNMAELAGI